MKIDLKPNLKELIDLLSQPGWTVYLNFLDDKIKDEFIRWHSNKANNKDEDLYIKGYIAGLEFAKEGIDKATAKILESKEEK